MSVDRRSQQVRLSKITLYNRTLCNCFVVFLNAVGEAITEDDYGYRKIVIELNYINVKEMWFQLDGALDHFAKGTFIFEEQS